MQCAYCSRNVEKNGYISQDLVFCNVRHAELFAEREAIKHDQRHRNGTVLHDKGLNDFRRETRQMGYSPRKR